MNEATAWVSVTSRARAADHRLEVSSKTSPANLSRPELDLLVPGESVADDDRLGLLAEPAATSGRFGSLAKRPLRYGAHNSAGPKLRSLSIPFDRPNLAL